MARYVEYEPRKRNRTRLTTGLLNTALLKRLKYDYLEVPIRVVKDDEVYHFICGLEAAGVEGAKELREYIDQHEDVDFLVWE